jgi:hypothetical protein
MVRISCNMVQQNHSPQNYWLQYYISMWYVHFKSSISFLLSKPSVMYFTLHPFQNNIIFLFRI